MSDESDGRRLFAYMHTCSLVCMYAFIHGQPVRVRLDEPNVGGVPLYEASLSVGKRLSRPKAAVDWEKAPS